MMRKGLQSRKNTTPKTEPIDERRRSSGACVKKKPCSKANPYAETSLRGSDQVSSLQGFMARVSKIVTWMTVCREHVFADQIDHVLSSSRALKKTTAL